MTDLILSSVFVLFSYPYDIQKFSELEGTMDTV